jgi:hypothetical protein
VGGGLGSGRPAVRWGGLVDWRHLGREWQAMLDRGWRWGWACLETTEAGQRGVRKRKKEPIVHSPYRVTFSVMLGPQVGEGAVMS